MGRLYTAPRPSTKRESKGSQSKKSRGKVAVLDGRNHELTTLDEHATEKKAALIAPCGPLHGPLRDYANISDEVESSPWARKTVLTFDGGGIRGFSTLLILQCLMAKIQEVEHTTDSSVNASGDYPWIEKISPLSNDTESLDKYPSFLPCHYFDYMAGASTGGLSAIMLGRLRMSADEALNAYTRFGQSVFGNARWWNERSLLYFPRAKYPSRKIRGAITEVIYEKLKEDNPKTTPYQAKEEPFSSRDCSRDHKTRIILFSFCEHKEAGIDYLHLWRTYDHDKSPEGERSVLDHMNPSQAHTEPLWQVARATFTAPTFFESIKIGDKKFLDGTFGVNNPSEFAFREIRHKERYAPGLFISIGSGIKTRNRTTGEYTDRDFYRNDKIDNMPRKQGLKKYLELGRSANDKVTDTEETNNLWLATCHANQTECYRFNVGDDLGTIPLDDWRPLNSGETTLNDIRELTEKYLASEETQKELDYCAKYLVLKRRARAKTQRWESFATDIEYYCPFESCIDKDACHYNSLDCRHLLRKHLKYSHKEYFQSHPDKFEALLNAGRYGPRSKEAENAREKILKRAATTGLSNATRNT